ncbi:SPFH domain-containing protein [Streptomyces sp. NPDC056987]|uniref:SPFH domain-containing protein n=1 Tax=Streptomyces sp. NPDC056987 TaxID=3345988 RepID=UPI00363A9175
MTDTRMTVTMTTTTPTGDDPTTPSGLSGPTTPGTPGGPRARGDEDGLRGLFTVRPEPAPEAAPPPEAVPVQETEVEAAPEPAREAHGPEEPREPREPEGPGEPGASLPVGTTGSDAVRAAAEDPVDAEGPARTVDPGRTADPVGPAAPPEATPLPDVADVAEVAAPEPPPRAADETWTTPPRAVRPVFELEPGAFGRGNGVSVRSARPAHPGDRPRWSPLIVGETTHEIPVHLLFRDEPGTHPQARAVAGGPVRPTVVGRRRGTGEQPRIRHVPAPAPATAVPARAAPPGDPRLTERPGPALPGSAAALVGLAALLGCAAVAWWAGALPDTVTEALRLPSFPYDGIGLGEWALLALGATVALFAFGGLGRGQVGRAWVLTLFGDYRGSVRRTGLLWVSPLLLRRRVDVRLRHWRSEPMPAVDANGTALRVVVLVVWRVRDTVQAALGVQDHEEYLREQVEAAMARVLSQLPADAFHHDAPTLRNAEAVGGALTRMLSAECRPVGVEVFSAQPTRIEYAPEIAAAMQRSRIAAIDARQRDSVLTSVVDAVDDTVHRLTSRGLVELDDYERKALVKDLTVAFYTGRQGAAEQI